MRAVRCAWVLLAALLFVAACGGSGGGSSASGGTSASSSSPSASGSSASGSASGSAAGPGGNAGCPGVGRAIPAGAQSKQTIDVDGDGRPDIEWIATAPDANGGVPFGVRTASGAVLTATITSASPLPRQVMFADVTGRGEIVALASDGRQVLLYAVSRCQIVAEKNVQGKQYAFDLGFTGYGTGVGCVDANGDGTTDLVGLKYVPEAQGEGTIQRTIVTLNGPNARNGATDTVPASNANLAEEARSISCGDQTLTANGVSSGP